MWRIRRDQLSPMRGSTSREDTRSSDHKKSQGLEVLDLNQRVRRTSETGKSQIRERKRIQRIGLREVSRDLGLEQYRGKKF